MPVAVKALYYLSQAAERLPLEGLRLADAALSAALDRQRLLAWLLIAFWAANGCGALALGGEPFDMAEALEQVEQSLAAQVRPAVL